MEEADFKNNKIIKILAEHLGVEIEDIHEDDSLVDDLHMNATDLTDFSHSLSSAGFDVDSLDFREIETINDLITSIGQEEL